MPWHSTVPVVTCAHRVKGLHEILDYMIPWPNRINLSRFDIFFLPGAALHLFPPLWPKPRWPPCSWNCKVMIGCWWFWLSQSWLCLAVVPLADYSSDFHQIFKCHISGCTRQTFTSTMSARGSGQGNTQCERPPGRVEDKHLQNIINKLMLVKSELGKMDFTK